MAPEPYSSFWTIGKRHLLMDVILNLLPTLLLIYLFFKKSKPFLLNGNGSGNGSGSGNGGFFPAQVQVHVNLALASIAIYTIVKFVALTLYSVYIRKIRRPNRNIPLSSYNGKWAIITGATSTVGSAFAVQFATKCNMNLCLIGKDGDKLQKLATHIQAQTLTKKAEQHQHEHQQKVQVITIANDFGGHKPGAEAEAEAGAETQTQTHLDFQAHLDAQLRKMVAQYKATGKGGIGALVNCMNYRNEIPCLHHDHNMEDVERMMKTNVQGTCQITDSVLAYLRQQAQGRQQGRDCTNGSAVITVASHSIHHPTPMMSVYSATNAYRHAYGTAYYDGQYYKKHYGIEFLSITPELMSSNMPRKRLNAEFVRSPKSADRIVDAALRNLGYQSEYYSFLGHAQSTIIPHIMWIHPWHRFLNKMKMARLEMLRNKRT